MAFDAYQSIFLQKVLFFCAKRFTRKLHILHTMSEENFIPGIYNYCDRWCERCAFTSRCRTFLSIEEWERKNDEKETDNWENLAEYLAETFQSVHEMLQQHAKEEGLDLDEMLNAPMSPEPEATKFQEQLGEWSMDYGVELFGWFEANADWLEECANTAEKLYEMGVPNIKEKSVQFGEALDILQWYGFFIGAKVKRAMHGINEEIEDEEYLVQNDNNGSAKVALIAVNRSMAAWKIVMNHSPEKTDEIIDFLVTLEKIRRGVEQECPNAQQFIRPGFDD